MTDIRSFEQTLLNNLLQNNARIKFVACCLLTLAPLRQNGAGAGYAMADAISPKGYNYLHRGVYTDRPISHSVGSICRIDWLWRHQPIEIAVSIRPSLPPRGERFRVALSQSSQLMTPSTAPRKIYATLFDPVFKSGRNLPVFQKSGNQGSHSS